MPVACHQVGVCIWVDSVAGGNTLHADGVFLSEKEITGTVSERAVKLGGATKTEEIKIMAAEMQMCASSAAMF